MGQLLKIDLDLADDLTLAVRLHILYLNMQVLDALHDVERADLVPHWVIAAGDLECVAPIALNAESDSCISSRTTVRAQLSRINNVHREDAALHNVLFVENRMHMLRRFLYALHLLETLFNLSRSLLLIFYTKL